MNFTADQIGAKHPGSVPTFLAKAVLGGDLIKLLTTSMKVSNEKISKIYGIVTLLLSRGNQICKVEFFVI